MHEAGHLLRLLALSLGQALLAPQSPVMEQVAEQLPRGRAQTSLPLPAQVLKHSIAGILPHRPAHDPC